MIEKMGIDGIYVVHAKEGYRYHEERITKLFAASNLPFEFVTDGDPACFTDELLNHYFTAEVQQNLSKGILSCTLNHILSYEKMAARKNRYALVFENDPFFIGNFVAR